MAIGMRHVQILTRRPRPAEDERGIFRRATRRTLVNNERNGGDDTAAAAASH